MIFQRSHGGANVATLVERKTRYVALYRNEDRRSRRVLGRLAGLLGPLPAPARRSVTFDRGLEFLAWRELTKATKIDVWLGRSAGPASEGRRRECERAHPALVAVRDAGRGSGRGRAREALRPSERHAAEVPRRRDPGGSLRRRDETGQ